MRQGSTQEKQQVDCHAANRGVKQGVREGGEHARKEESRKHWIVFTRALCALFIYSISIVPYFPAIQ